MAGVAVLKNMTIGRKLLVMLAAPVLGVVVFAGASLLDKRDVAARTSALAELAQLGVAMSNFVHESQKERGMTGVFVGSGGEKLGDELQGQREVADEQLGKLRGALDGFDRGAFGPEFERRLQTALGFVEKLQGHRAAVDELSIEGTPAVVFYTDTNAAFLDAIARIGSESDSAELSRLVVPYVSFMRAKEKTGVERATMANAFAAGRFAQAAEIQKFIGGVGAQDAFLHDFELTASPAARAFYERTVAGPAVDEAADMREVALAHVNAADLGGVDPVGWYEAMTAKINLMKKVEDRLAADLLGRAGELKAAAARSLVVTAVLVLFALAFTLALALVVTRSVTRPVGVLVDRMRSMNEHCLTALRNGLAALAGGDLTVAVQPATQPIPDPGGDEIGVAARTLNGMVEKTQEAVAQYNTTRESLVEKIASVASSAGTVAEASREMASSSEQAGRAVAEVATAVSDVAQGAERQVRAVESAREITTEMADATSESAEHARNTADAARQASELAETGASAVAEATDAMRAVRASSAEATAAIRELGAKSDQIGGIVETITGIAGQTNLLALNAAIEAARAGEQGRGFAVVAEEVRKLAEESQRAAASIAELIEQIQGETQRAVTVVETGAERTTAGADTVEQAREAFVAIQASVQDMSDRVAQIAAAVGQVAASSSTMQDNIGEVASVAEESSASAEQVSASTQQTSASTQEIAASAQHLATTAEELLRVVAAFKLTVTA